jgi:multicomponent Na+:H+ antiporter subunit D
MMTASLWIHPGFILFAGAVLLPAIPERYKKGWLLLIPVLVFLRVIGLEHGVYGTVPFLDMTLTFGRVDRLSQIFGYIMSLMCLVSSLYGLHVRRDADHIAAWLYVTGSLGVLYAGDYFVLFLFWELMAFSSVFLIWFRGRAQSPGAGYRYLLVHVFGGLLLLAGIVLRWKATGGIAFDAVGVDSQTPGTTLIMLGFILNAAVPPLHAWLPDAYSEATVTGSVFLCAFTTKTAVYALCRGFAGMEILIPLGVVMAVYGVVYAVLENDARKLLAYHIISQVGYMVTAVGFGTTMAINGACAHAFAHILYKGLLFMGTGSVLQMTGESRFTHLGGLYKKMPWAFVFTLVGGLSISAFPLFSGFVSKSIIVAAGFSEHQYWAAFLLMLASSGTFLHTGLKVPYFIWFGKNNCSPETWERAREAPWNMNAAMAIAAILCIFIGCYTPYLYNLLPYPMEYHPYTAYHVSETLQILLFTALGFFLFIDKMRPEAKISIDMDWFYRMAARAFMWVARRPIQTADYLIGEIYRVGGLVPLMATARFSAWFDWHAIDGVVDGFARSVRRMGGQVRRLQTDQLQLSILYAFLVVGAMVGWYILSY